MTKIENYYYMIANYCDFGAKIINYDIFGSRMVILTKL